MSRLYFAADSSAPSTGPLRSLLLALTHAALASSLVVGCDSESEEPIETGDAGIDASIAARLDAGRDSATAPRADGGETADRADAAVPVDAGETVVECMWRALTLPGALKTTRAIEFLGGFRSYGTAGAAADGAVALRYTNQYAAQGAACAGVADPAACERQLGTLEQARLCINEPCEPYAIVREAGSLRRLDTRAELLALLGPIDAPADALFLASLSGRQLCGFADVPPERLLVRATTAGYELTATYDDCTGDVFQDRIQVDTDGTLTVVEHRKVGDGSCIAGRRPDGLQTVRPARALSPRAAYLAASAQLEAASVHAFEQLARELTALNAPRALIEAAIEAQHDELRHTRAMAALARAHGAEPAAPVVQPTAPRSPLALALDNVAEGCVRETFGALLATYQAASARDHEVRKAMSAIAEDETRHAALSWKLQAWLETQLTPSERAQVEAERAAALATLQRELAVGLPAADRSALGLPSPELASTLLGALSAALPQPRC